MAKDGGLHAVFKTYLPDGDWQKIETGFVNHGVPDDNYCFLVSGKGAEGWVEFKKCEANAVSNMKPEQIAWAERRSRKGGRCFVAVRRLAKAGKRRVACDELHLFKGTQARALRLGGLTGAKALGRWPGGPARWPWAVIKGFLTS